MEALQDMSWMRQLYASSPLERFKRGAFSVGALAARGGSARHDGRYRYRLLFFGPRDAKPVMAINLESDILGSWRLTMQSGSSSHIVASFDEAPSYEDFKALALPLADEEASRAAGGLDGKKVRRKSATKRAPGSKTTP